MIKLTEANKLCCSVVFFFSIEVHRIDYFELYCCLVDQRRLFIEDFQAEKVALVLCQYAEQTDCCYCQNRELACSH